MEQPADTGGPAGVAAVAALQPDRPEVPVVAQPPSGVSQPPPLELGLAGATQDSPTLDLGRSGIRLRSLWRAVRPTAFPDRPAAARVDALDPVG